jgi:hypothetical protein
MLSGGHFLAICIRYETRPSGNRTIGPLATRVAGGARGHLLAFP